MSHDATRHVLKYSKARGAARFVLTVLADHCNGKIGEFIAWPSLDTLAQETALAKWSVCRALDKLENDLGEISRQRSNGGRNKRTHYTIHCNLNSHLAETVSKPLNSHTERLLAKNKQSPWSNETGTQGDTLLTGKEPEDSVATAPHAPDQGFPEAPSGKEREYATRGRRAADVDSRIKPFFAFWGERYQRRFHGAYSFSGAKEGSLIKRLPASYDLEKLKTLAIEFFESDDLWVAERGGYTIGVFCSQLNRLVSTAPARRRVGGFVA
jgi:hypothetical protein